MVHVEFIDGTTEDLEVDNFYEWKDDPYKYNAKTTLFEVRHDGYTVSFPREFVKSIRYIPVD